MDFEQFQKFKFKDTIVNFIIPIIATLAAGGLVAFFIFPSNSKIAILESEITSASELSAKLEQKTTKLRSLRDFKSSVDENNALMNRVMPAEPLVPQLLTQIDIIAKEAGLEVTKLGYALGDTGTEGSQQAKPYEIVAITLGVTGTTEQSKVFLEGLENSGRVVNVNNVRYSLGEDGKVSYSFVLISPFVKIVESAVTDDPISFDIADRNFQDLVSNLKKLKIYDISLEEVNVEFASLEESSGDASALSPTVPATTPVTPPVPTGSAPTTPIVP